MFKIQVSPLSSLSLKNTYTVEYYRRCLRRARASFIRYQLVEQHCEKVSSFWNTIKSVPGQGGRNDPCNRDPRLVGFFYSSHAPIRFRCNLGRWPVFPHSLELLDLVKDKMFTFLAPSPVYSLPITERIDAAPDDA